MTTRIISYVTCTRLQCGFVPNAQVFLCVSDDIVAPSICDFPTPILSATVLAGSSVCDGINIYTYCLSYDDADLIEGATLSRDNILGIFCADCQSTWIQEKIGQEPSMSGEDGNYQYTNRYGCVTEFSFSGGVGPPGLSRLLLYGNGSDGDFTVENGTDYSQEFQATNKNYNNLTIDAGGIYRPWGITVLSGDLSYQQQQWFQIFVKDTLTINGVFSSTIPESPPNASGSTAGRSDFYIDSGSGGAMDGVAEGGHGVYSAFNPENNDGYFSGASLLASSNGWMGGSLGGKGGDCGTGSGPGPGGVGGDPQSELYTRPVYSGSHRYQFGGNYLHCARLMPFLTQFNNGLGAIEAGIGGGCSGGGGGGGGHLATGSAVGGGGGGGGFGGGPMFICARHIVIGASGSIESKGGDGGNGGNAVAGGGGDSAPGGGGGGGGGGGLVYLLYDTLTIAAGGDIDVSGGAGGSGGVGVGGAGTGAAGDSGLDGNICKLNLLTGVIS